MVVFAAMRLTQTELKKRMEAGTLRLALVGMSGTGKTFRTHGMAQVGHFSRIGIDDRIDAHLNEANTGETAAWMGPPGSPTYAQRSAEYLALEEQFLAGALDSQPSGNLLIDTTGSTPHLPAGLLNRLKEETFLVHLQSTDDMIEKLLETYRQDPKPVVFGEHFVQEAGESHEDALVRCFGRLVQWREGRFCAMADATVSAQLSRGEATHQEFLQQIIAALPPSY